MKEFIELFQLMNWWTIENGKFSTIENSQVENVYMFL